MTKPTKLKETEVVPKDDVLCNDCNQIITVSDKCKDYFMVGDIIFCSKEKHYCSECVDEHKEEIEDGKLS